MTKNLMLINGFFAIAMTFGPAITAKAQSRPIPAEYALEKTLAVSDEIKPTLERVEKGRALLVKIIDVLETIPLMDSDAVMKEFGVADVGYKSYPSYVRAYPKNSEMNLQGAGLTQLSVSPWERGKSLANLNGLVSSEICIRKMDVDEILGPPYKSEPIVLIDQAPPIKEFYPTSFSYSIDRSPLLGFSIHVGVSIYSGICVERFGAIYVKKGVELNGK